MRKYPGHVVYTFFYRCFRGSRVSSCAICGSKTPRGSWYCRRSTKAKSTLSRGWAIFKFVFCFNLGFLFSSLISSWKISCEQSTSNNIFYDDCTGTDWGRKRERETPYIILDCCLTIYRWSFPCLRVLGAFRRGGRLFQDYNWYYIHPLYCSRIFFEDWYHSKTCECELIVVFILQWIFWEQGEERGKEKKEPDLMGHLSSIYFFLLFCWESTFFIKKESGWGNYGTALLIFLVFGGTFVLTWILTGSSSSFSFSHCRWRRCSYDHWKRCHWLKMHVL